MVDCIEWPHYTDPKGYGAVRVGAKMRRAHRVAYCEANGVTHDDIKHKVVRHTCDNPGCVNPQHLLLGTHADNTADKLARSRQARGEGHGQRVLTAEAVRAIRASTCTTAELAKHYQVARRTITNARSGITWAHI